MNGIECLGERVADMKFLVVQDARLDAVLAAIDEFTTNACVALQKFV